MDNENAVMRYEAQRVWEAGNVDDVNNVDDVPEDCMCWACTCDTCKG